MPIWIAVGPAQSWSRARKAMELFESDRRSLPHSGEALRFTVRVLVRSSSPRANISPRDEVAVGDLLDRASLAAALKGMRYLVHVAADYRLWAPSPDDTATLRNVSKGSCVTSWKRRRSARGSSASSTPARLQRSICAAEASQTRTRSLPASAAIGAYKRSKVIAEQVVAEMIARQGLPAVIVNPSTPIGPRDIKPTPTGRIIIEAASGRMPAFVDTGLNFAHVDDVAAGHLAALRRGRIGERYILGGENITLRQMLIDIGDIIGRRSRPLRLPRSAVYPIAYGAELMARLTGREPFATVDGLRMAKYTMHFDDAKARRELGYTSRPYREGIAEAIEWFIAAGYMKRPRTMTT